MKELKQLRKAGLHVVDSAPLFRCGYFVFAYNQEQWEALCNALHVDVPVSDSACGLSQAFVRNAQYLYAIGVFGGGLDTLVHECAHTVFKFCHDTGIEVACERANETFCYLLDWLFGEGVKGNRAVFKSCVEEPGGK